MRVISRRGLSGETATSSAVVGCLFAPMRGRLENPLRLPAGQTYPHRQKMKDIDSAGSCKEAKEAIDSGIRHVGRRSRVKAASTMRRIGLAAFFCIGTLVLAQTTAFKTRLSPVAMDATMRNTVAGSGSVSAQLTGSKLVIKGSFEGLLSPATTAQMRESVVTGVVGPAIFDLTITKATSGAISGSIDLTPEQAEALRKGRLYVQVNSEKAPAGNLWGWLLS